jgi:hypothetical protein
MRDEFVQDMGNRKDALNSAGCEVFVRSRDQTGAIGGQQHGRKMRSSRIRLGSPVRASLYASWSASQ